MPQEYPTVLQYITDKRTGFKGLTSAWTAAGVGVTFPSLLRTRSIRSDLPLLSVFTIGRILSTRQCTEFHIKKIQIPNSFELYSLRHSKSNHLISTLELESVLVSTCRDAEKNTKELIYIMYSRVIGNFNKNEVIKSLINTKVSSSEHFLKCTLKQTSK